MAPNRISSMALRVGAALTSARCATCGGPVGSAMALCESCMGALARDRPPPCRAPGVDVTSAALTYSGAGRRLVTAIKVRRLLPLTTLAAELMAPDCAAIPIHVPLVPVPGSAIRNALRGFDPAAELAFRLSRVTAHPLALSLRRLDRASRRGRSRQQRIASPPRITLARPAPAAAVLVDDVLTTGATLGACAGALRAAGCGWIGAVVLAAAPPPRRPFPNAARQA